VAVPSSIVVRRPTTGAELLGLWDAGAAAFQAQFRCTPGVAAFPPWQNLLELVCDPSLFILAAWDQDDAPLMYTVVRREDGRIVWLVACTNWEDLTPAGDADHSAYAQLGLAIVAECDACWGIIENYALRQRLLAVSEYIHAGELDERRSEWRSEPRAASPATL
jgi:hypothetical protein